jgi:hypothetical protein
VRLVDRHLLDMDVGRVVRLRPRLVRVEGNKGSHTRSRIAPEGQTGTVRRRAAHPGVATPADD